MDSFNVFINLLLTIELCFFNLLAGAYFVYLCTYCPNATISPASSIYDKNINSLVSSLSSNSTQKNGFYNATAGQDPSTKVYGLYLCREDVAQDVCQDCVATSDLQYRPWLRMWNTQNISEVERFMKLLEKTMNDTAARAPNDRSGSGKKFSTGEVNFTSFHYLYTLVQCTSDLSAVICNIRYELYRFYRVEATAPAPSPVPVLLPPAPKPRGKSRISTGTIIAIVAPIVVSVLLFAIGCYFLVRKSRKKFSPTQEDRDGDEISTVEFLQFDFGVIEVATNKFSEENKLGEGGFRVVYKGILPSGQEIAVKRLSLYSGQGLEEFKNEVVVAWKHWSEGTALHVLDETLIDSYSKNEVMRCIQLGFLCVQENPAERPTMGTILLCHSSNASKISIFYSETNQWKELGSHQTTNKSMPYSVDEASITEVQPR
uniref:Gnk2-homologous domain-containing protein n=1 Tax=Manihot esculenta TaxID=3983 RepID=A0A2C9U7B5_MANES